MKLSKKQFKKLIDAPCAYCGVLPSNVFKNHKETYIYNGIDRIDSKKGYTIDNVLSCCSDCNIAKLTKDISEFSEWFKRLIFYNKWDYHNINSVKFINIKFSGQ